jgi:hypothetical protein
MISDQAAALQKTAFETGIINQPPPPSPTDLLEGEPGQPDIPWVHLPTDGRLAHEFNKEVGAICKGAGLYRYKEKIVTVSVNEKTFQSEIRAVSPHRFRDWVERRLMVPFRYAFNRNGAIKVKQTMGVEHALTCLESDSFSEQQSRLLRVNRVRLPYLRKNGHIELLPEGYDEESSILTIGPGWEYDEEMTPDQARHKLAHLIREVPFQDERSRAVFFAGMFSQYGYFLQPLGSKRMNFLFHANSQGTGKTLLAQVILTTAWKVASIDAMPDNAKDLKDRLDTAVREAKPYVVLDDIDRAYLKSGVMNSFMTASWWSGRKFHAQEEFTEPKTPVIFMTANNLELTPDISRRTLVCDLFAPEANLTDRVIESPIDDTYIAEPTIHAQICSALWALMKEWRDSGRKHEGKEINGYQSWCRIFGGLTMSAGFGDPCIARDSDEYIDTEKADIHALMSRLAEGVEKTAEFEFHDIVDICRELNCFPHMIKGKMVKFTEGEEKIMVFEPTSETNSNVGLLLGRYGGKTFMVQGRKVLFDKRGKNRHRRYVLQVVPVVGAAGSNN